MATTDTPTPEPTPEPTRRPVRRWALIGAAVVTVAVVAISPSRGRAEPTGEYRPPLPPDALTNGCFPLPDDVRLGFPYQVRYDDDVDGRRLLDLQYNLIDQAAAVQGVADAFIAAGFAVTDQDDGEVSLAKGPVEVSAQVTPYDVTTDDQIVRGAIRLDLPVVARQSEDPVCYDVSSTKRFAQDGDPRDDSDPYP